MAKLNLFHKAAIVAFAHLRVLQIYFDTATYDEIGRDVKVIIWKFLQIPAWVNRSPPCLINALEKTSFSFVMSWHIICQAVPIFFYLFFYISLLSVLILNWR